MCLDTGEKGKEAKKFVKSLKMTKDKYITLWKVFDINDEGNLISQFYDYKFTEGKNTADEKEIKDLSGLKALYQYKSGFHCFADEASAERWTSGSINEFNRDRVVKPVKVRKTWITSIGWQSGAGGTIAICKHIII